MENTPKAKLEKAKANKEKKKQIRVYQSTIDKNCGIVLTDEQVSKFGQLLKDSVKNHVKGTLKTATEPAKGPEKNTKKATEGEETAKVSDEPKKKKGRKEGRKTIKIKELVMGLNEVLKKVPKGEISVICLEENFAANAKNIVHKLASEHRIPTFELKLSDLRSIFNITQLTIIGFHANTRQESSPFFGLTQHLFDNLKTPPPKANEGPKSVSKAAEKEMEIKPEPVDEPEECIAEIVIPKYQPEVCFKSSTNRQESYRERMLRILSQTVRSFDDCNDSVLNLADESPVYFPPYSSPQPFGLLISQDLTKADHQQRSHSMAEQIYDFTGQKSSQRSSQSNPKSGQKRAFQEPRMLKLDVPVSQAKKQKKQDKKNAKKLAKK